MNYMKQVAEMLGVELNERFKLVDYDGTWYFGNRGLNCEGTTNYNEDILLCEILYGKEEIEKLPWKPKHGETYWLVFRQSESDYYSACATVWRSDSVNYESYICGNCFKTKNEAEAAIPWYKENIERVNRGEKWRVEK